MLKCKMVKTIDVGDWDSLVSETYGRIYNYQQQDGCKSRGSYPLEAYGDIDPEWYDYENTTVKEEVNGPEEGVSFKAWLERDPKQPIQTKDGPRDDYGLTLWWERNFYPSAETVASDLVKRGLMEPGEYVINVDW